ncbi:haloacid dehalogenase-like hydrolase domain-containing protein At4g39970 isoform X2 [Brachypodium distachyon]|uniref:haloacid dehalogenase-like hydrolase domain-containing protein At4g39970 isoform X2 n=1 Tax=Brachypodium distachyon TaxID=15368 RepID=UPI000D0C9FC3|nr:haloacid dehalogenase-like hydrolase domain-containing protein At4g39970 isoform X2 [Brachypodium distachyon]|eukprot:XP_024316586.1 haloacid dehalogenase-like hydrolase domain-containing protein At4g39970 isoform X2 [Brachypodium distachyon]
MAPMASTSLLTPVSFPTAAATARRSFSTHRSPSGALPRLRLRPRSRRASGLAVSASAASPPLSLDALIFDCDGVILESEHLHRQAYNDAFAHFGVRCPPAADAPLDWDEAFYDDLQNRIGGGKPKMRWYFGENGWPSSKLFETPPSSDSDKEKLVDIIQVYLFISLAPCLIQDCLEYVCSPVPTSHLFKVNKTSVCSVIFPLLTEALVLQDWKTERYKEIIKSGTVEPRPGVLRLMDEVKGAGIKLAVCSAATKSSVVLCLENLIGLERFNGLDCFLAGDDVKLKKPDPSIYITAAKKLGVESKNCLVVEDSVIGLQKFLSFDRQLKEQGCHV